MEYYHPRYSSGKRKKKSKFSRFLLFILLILIIAALIVAYLLYKVILKPNTWAKDDLATSVYIPTGSSYEDLKTILYEKGIVINRNDFEWLAKKKNLPKNIHPGRYMVKAGMSNDELINLLRSGEQTPVKIIFNNIRTKEEFAKNIAAQIEPDSADIIRLINDSSCIEIFTPETILTLFIPNTYEVYWNITTEDFIDRMYTEYNKFWNTKRRQKAEQVGLEPFEVSILASIVEKETGKDDEKPTIAGVYFNRMKYGWRLQADPTIVYAWGDFNINIKRVLNLHKRIDSPYNTYVYYGLPPGPICVPSISSIDAVLNREDHSYLFFCAKDDFSGYHVFANTNAQHIVNANKYRKALDERNIKK